MFKTIVVGYDGTPYGDAALSTARSMAGIGTRLVIVHVSEILTGRAGAYPRHVDEPEERTALEATVRDLRSEGIDVEVVIYETHMGGPAPLIIDATREFNADLIVVGSRSQAPITQVILGSVPLRLLQSAPCPVMVVPLPPDT